MTNSSLKRPLNDFIKVSSARSSCSQEQPWRRAAKRPRTTKFLETQSQFENVKNTCSFFDKELRKMKTLSSLLTLKQNTIHQSVVSSIAKELGKKEEEFESFHRSVECEVQEKLQLNAAYKSVEAAIVDQPETTAKSFHVSELAMLNQGTETNAFILNTIAGFAGVPSVAEFQDLQELSLNLKR